MPVPLLKPEVPAEVLSDLKKGVIPESVGAGGRLRGVEHLWVGTGRALGLL